MRSNEAKKITTCWIVKMRARHQSRTALVNSIVVLERYLYLYFSHHLTGLTGLTGLSRANMTISLRDNSMTSAQEESHGSRCISANAFAHPAHDDVSRNTYCKVITAGRLVQCHMSEHASFS
jgi:hypothetical protein